MATSEYLEMVLSRIVDGTEIDAVEIWLHHSGKWLGCLIDGRHKTIPDSTPWNPQPSLEALIDKLASMADTYRQERRVHRVADQ